MRRMWVSAAFLTAGRLATLDPEALPGLTSLAFGGESCPGALAARWVTGRRLGNLYGPTETPVYASACRSAADSAGATQDPPIGRPIPGAHIHLLDRAGRLVPLGTPGEI